MSEVTTRAALPDHLSDKFRFWSFVSMVLLVFVHGYTLPPTYLQPWTLPEASLGVTAFLEYGLANGLLRFRIPMLFAISGFLFALHDAQSHRVRMKKRVRSLLVPYFLWSGIHLLALFFMEMEPASRAWVLSHGIATMGEHKSLVHDYEWSDVLIRWLLVPMPYQLWFIRVLFIYNLAYPLLARWVTGSKSIPIFFSLAAAMWLGGFNFFFVEGEGLLFFGLGIWMQKTGFLSAGRRRWLKTEYWASLWVASAMIKTWLAFEGHALWGDAVFPMMLLLHKLCVFSGLVTAWYGSDRLVRQAMAVPWFVSISAFAFMIYALHAPLVALLIDPCLRLFEGFSEPHLVTFLVLPVALIAASVALGAMLRVTVPRLYGLLTGGRGMNARRLAGVHY